MFFFFQTLLYFFLYFLSFFFIYLGLIDGFKRTPRALFPKSGVSLGHLTTPGGAGRVARLQGCRVAGWPQGAGGAILVAPPLPLPTPLTLLTPPRPLLLCMCFLIYVLFDFFVYYFYFYCYFLEYFLWLFSHSMSQYFVSPSIKVTISMFFFVCIFFLTFLSSISYSYLSVFLSRPLFPFPSFLSLLFPLPLNRLKRFIHLCHLLFY